MKKIKELAFYCIPMIMIICSFITIFENTIWVDESFSLELAKHSMIDLIKLDSLDVHPPLYYIILKVGYIILGGIWDYIWIGKFMSLIPYIILILIGIFVIRKKFGETVAFYFNIFVVGMPQMLKYSTEIRMYSWGMLFVTCAFLQLAKILSDNEDNRKAFCLLTVFSALAAYTHYFACASAIVIYAELFVLSLIRKSYGRIKSIIISGLGVVVLYLPWLFVFIAQTSAVKECYWISPVTLGTIKKNVLFLFNTKTIVEVAIVLLVIVASIKAIKMFAKKENDIAICGIGVWGGTILLGVVLSLVIRPIFVSRYMMGASACFWLGIAIALSKIEMDKLKKFIVVIASCICIVESLLYVKNEFRTEKNLSDTYQVLNENINAETKIISDYNQVQKVVSYYFPQNESIVVGENLSDMTIMVYASCNLKRVESVNDLDVDSFSNVLVLDKYGEINKELEKKVESIEYLGNFKMDRYQFDVYYIK